MFIRYYNLYCDYCNKLIAKFTNNKPDKHTIHNSFNVYRDKVFCSTSCRNKYKLKNKINEKEI